MQHRETYNPWPTEIDEMRWKSKLNFFCLVIRYGHKKLSTRAGHNLLYNSRNSIYLVAVFCPSFRHFFQFPRDESICDYGTNSALKKTLSHVPRVQVYVFYQLNPGASKPASFSQFWFQFKNPSHCYESISLLSLTSFSNAAILSFQ